MTALSETHASSGLDTLRNRGVFLFSVLTWGAAIGAIIAGISCVSFALNQCLAVVDRLRIALGLRPPDVGPDWFTVSGIGFVTVVLIAAVAALLRAYYKTWRRRMEAVWVSSTDLRRFKRLNPLRARASDQQRQEHMAYLRALLASPEWSGCWPTLRAVAGLQLHSDPVTIPTEHHHVVAVEIFKKIEADIAERAIATGMIVGLSKNARMDAVTILLAAFELQMYVLSRLGKKPSLRTWIALVKRCGASMFFNSYLNRGDALALSFTIKQSGVLLENVSDAMGHVSDSLGHVDLDHIGDVLHEGGLPDYVNLGFWGITTVTGIGVGIGRMGLNVVGHAIESIGDDLLQGVLAASAIYFHGMALAADCLALDQEHRTNPEMNRSFRECATQVAKCAGDILREQVLDRMRAFRKRRREAVLAVPKMLGPGLWTSVSRRFPRESANPAASGGANGD